MATIKSVKKDLVGVEISSYSYLCEQLGIKIEKDETKQAEQRRIITTLIKIGKANGKFQIVDLIESFKDSLYEDENGSVSIVHSMEYNYKGGVYKASLESKYVFTGKVEMGMLDKAGLSIDDVF
ncbi:MAG: hypothetical protein ACRCTZ_08245 [Sarcina sp.]